MGKRKFSIEIENDIVAKYKNGVSSIKIAEEYNVQPLTIRNIVKRNGEKVRSISETLIDTSRARKHSLNENYFNETMNENKAYVLGLLFSDGYVFEKDYKVGFASKDIELVSIIKSELNATNPIYARKNYDMKEINISSKTLYNSVVKLGCVQNKSHIVEFPNDLKEELYSHFIRGLWDGDGCIRLTGKRQDLSMDLVGSKFILDRVIEILRPITCSDSKVTKHGNVYRICYHGNKICGKLFDYLYKDASLYLKRKREIIVNRLSLD